MIQWKKELLTFPNLLSLLRLVCIPWYLMLYLHGHYSASGAVLVFSCLTDWLDGRIARQYHAVSNVGKILDPLADKATQLTLASCLSHRYRVLLPIVILLCIKELFQLLAAVHALLHRKMLPGALYAGKLCTTILFVSMIVLVLFPDIPRRWISLLSAVDILFILYAFWAYWEAFLGKNRKTQDI